VKPWREVLVEGQGLGDTALAHEGKLTQSTKDTERESEARSTARRRGVNGRGQRRLLRSMVAP